MHTPPSLPAWLRQEDLERWLIPLAQSLQLPFRVMSPEGALLLAVGEPFDAARSTLLLAHQVPVALLAVPADSPADRGAALAGTLAAYAEARVTVADMARSLAASWKESNFVHQLALWLEDVVEVEVAAAVIVRQLARVLKADSASLHLQLRGEWTLAADYEERAGALPLPPRSEALPAGEPTVIPALAGCQVYLPLSAGDEALGLLAISGPESLGLATNLKFLTSVGAQVSHALRLRALIPIEVENAQIRSELALAAELQRSLLPQSPPAFPGTAIAARCRTTQAVGGDGYDFLAHQDGLDLVVADVSGHGLASGLLMSSFLGMLRTQDRAHMHPAAIADRANHYVCQEVGTAGHYVTALYARLSPDGRRLAYTALGHPAPLRWRRGEVSALPVATGLPAGMNPGEHYPELIAPIEPGDVLLFYTDGLIEARDPAGAMFGQAGLMRALERLAPASPSRILEGLFDAVSAFSADAPSSDDQTAIVLALTPAQEVSP